MKKTIFDVLCLTLLSLTMVCTNSMAGSSGYGVSLGYGQSKDDIDIYRIGLKKDFVSQWFTSATGYVSGYFEFSYNLWNGPEDEIKAVALSPVFVYYFDKGNQTMRPYIEGGVGLAYINETRIQGRDMSTNFQFEDRIGVGVRMKSFDLNFRYMHYSNASIKAPNDGIDIWIGSLSWFF